MSNEPYSEQYRVLAEDWVDKDAAARLYDETKSIELARRKSLLEDMTDARAERIVRSSPEWADYIKRMVNARTDANKARLHLKVLEMRYYENQSQNATARAEMRMG